MKNRDFLIPSSVDVTQRDVRPVADCTYDALKRALDYDPVFQSKAQRAYVRKLAREMKRACYTGTVGDFLQQAGSALPDEINYFDEDTSISWRMQTRRCTLDDLQGALHYGFASGRVTEEAAVRRLVKQMKRAGYTGTVGEFLEDREEELA